MKRSVRVEYTCCIGVILFCAAAICRTFIAVGADPFKYHPYSVMSVMLELVFSIMTATTILTLVRNRYDKRIFVRFFIWMLALVTIGMMGDVSARGIGIEHCEWAPFTMHAGAFVRDIVGFPMIVVYSIYLISYINEDKRQLQRYALLVSGLCIDGILLVLIDQITSRSATDPWSMWDHPWLYFFFLSMPLAVSISIIFYYRNDLTNRIAIQFCCYELLVLAAVAVDIALEETALAYVAAAFALLHIYISVQIYHERRQEELLIKQRIAIMLSQIQPHFLYNVLTGIRALCRIEPQKAETALMDFTSYLRSNLNSLKEEGCIPFEKELQHIRHYVELEKMRYGDDLEVVFCTPVTDFSLPSLTLEPIVENAVRHGVMQREEGGTVTIMTSEEQNRFLISVADDGVGFDLSQLDYQSGDSIGLFNVKERLAAICGGEMEIKSTPGAGTVVMISLPKKGGSRR